MKTSRIIFVATTVAILAVSARADLSSQQLRPTLISQVASNSPATTSTWALQSSVVWSSSLAVDDLLSLAKWQDSPASPLASAEGQVIQQLPDLPSSAELFLSALLSIGGWQFVRSARHWHWGAIPAWYHTGCPDQIGHAVPFDFDFDSLPLCCFDQPNGGNDLLLQSRLGGGQTVCLASRSFPLATAPRGPPSLS